ncbi:MAG: metallophosphoesterase [Desulfurococcales archaeon]|nr:metallophosphoesterase [Desulfurococcales archaeon]
MAFRDGTGILAVSDVHSPRYLSLFVDAVNKASASGADYCLLIFAGDMILRGREEMLEPVLRTVNERMPGVRVVAVFGNEEYEDIRDSLRRRYKEITWLDDEYTVVECRGESYAIVGTTGALDRPTTWQRRHKPYLQRVYSERPGVIARLLKEAKSNAEKVILVSHYVLAKANLKGENPIAWPEMYSSAMERVVAETKPDAAIHGHAHNGSKFTLVAGVPVYNVSIPLRKSLTEIKFRRGLDAFF